MNPIRSMNEAIRIIIVDDHPIVRRGIGMSLSTQPRIRILGEAGDGHTALDLIRAQKPDVVLMDIDLPQMNGMALTELLRRELPQIKVIILSMYSNKDYVMRIIACGARGFVLKESSPRELLQAIEAVAAGETHFSADVARVALNQVVRGHGESTPAARLTNREREVLVHIADGLSNKEISTQLNIGVRTVETHRERIMRKLDIHTVAGLTRFAISNGLVSLAPYVPHLSSPAQLRAA